MITYFLVVGCIWLALVLFEPVVVYMDTVKKCDLKYASDREERAALYAQLNAIHQRSPIFQQMKEEKKAKKGTPSPYNAKARRMKRRKPLQEAYAAEQKRLADAETPKICSVEVVDP